MTYVVYVAYVTYVTYVTYVAYVADGTGRYSLDFLNAILFKPEKTELGGRKGRLIRFFRIFA